MKILIFQQQINHFLTLVEARGDERQNANPYCKRGRKIPFLIRLIICQCIIVVESILRDKWMWKGKFLSILLNEKCVTFIF